MTPTIPQWSKVLMHGRNIYFGYVWENSSKYSVSQKLFSKLTTISPRVNRVFLKRSAALGKWCIALTSLAGWSCYLEVVSHLDYNNLGQNEQIFMSYICSSIARIVFNLYSFFSIVVTANSYTKHFPLGPIGKSCRQKLQRIFL